MDSIIINDLTITPSLDKKIKNIHPAIDIVNDSAFVGIWVPCEIKGKKEGEIQHQDKLFLVSDKYELIMANDVVFRNNGLPWKLAFKPIEFPNRWKLEQVKKYLEKKIFVEPKKLLEKMISIYEKYIEMPNELAYLFHALWDIGTYFHPLFNSYCYLYIGGIKRTGKTKTLDVHSCLAFNAVSTSNLSTAAIFRLVQNARCTLLLDETEKLSYKGKISERGMELRSVLLSGYKKGGNAYRVVKTRNETLKPQPFEVYGPKGLANIRGLEDVVDDRCIATIMKRGLKPKIMNLEVSPNNSEWSELRSELYVFFFTYWRQIKEIYHEIDIISELSEVMNVPKDTFTQEDLGLIAGRELELWKPIITLAIFFKKIGYVINTSTHSLSSLHNPVLSILKLAIEVAKQRSVMNLTETGEVILLQVLNSLVQEDKYYYVKTIREKMLQRYDGEQSWLTNRWIGAALRRLSFQDSRRLGTGYQYNIKVKDVEDLVKRLGIPDDSEDPPQDKISKFCEIPEPKRGKKCEECEGKIGFFLVLLESKQKRVCCECKENIRKKDYSNGLIWQEIPFDEWRFS